MSLLSVRDLHVHLGQAHVLHGVSFDVPEGAVTALLGRNGVGKTTTLRSLVGLVGREGVVEYAGESIAALPTHRVIRRGIGYVPEDREIFAGLTVEENLRLAERSSDPRYDLVYDLFPELRDSDIVFTNARDVYAPAMADHTMAYILAFARCFPPRRWLSRLPSAGERRSCQARPNPVSCSPPWPRLPFAISSI